MGRIRPPLQVGSPVDWLPPKPGRVSFASSMEEACALGYSVQPTAIGGPRQLSQGRRDVFVCLEIAFGWTQAGTTAVSRFPICSLSLKFRGPARGGPAHGRKSNERAQGLRTYPYLRDSAVSVPRAGCNGALLPPPTVSADLETRTTADLEIDYMTASAPPT